MGTLSGPDPKNATKNLLWLSYETCDEMNKIPPCKVGLIFKQSWKELFFLYTTVVLNYVKYNLGKYEAMNHVCSNRVHGKWNHMYEEYECWE